MPRGRKRYRSPPTTMRKVKARRGRSFSRTKRKITKLALKTHSFVERLPSEFLNVMYSPTTSDGLFKFWTLDDVPQAANYKGLFELYKIHKIVVEFRYKSVGLPFNGGNRKFNELNPVLYIKRDHNDVMSLAGGEKETLDELKESSKTFEIQLTNDRPSFTMVLKPAFLTKDTDIVGSTGIRHVPTWNKWLDAEDGGIKHYGLKAYVVGRGDGSEAGVAPLGQVEVTYKMYFSMKGNE